MHDKLLENEQNKERYALTMSKQSTDHFGNNGIHASPILP